MATAPLLATPPAGTLQEVAPPQGVQQLRSRLDQRQPRLRIQAPSDGTVLPAGDWALELQLQDWPLVDAGDLGLGPHLVVQIDQQAARRISAPTAPAALSSSLPPQEQRLRVTLPALEPGSHRVTVYAARPWGEAVKAGSASDQIRVHRVAPNPLAVPLLASPQLIPVSPESLSPRQPVLIDWLLRDAPLQGLREGDGGWRLRITVNGDSFLVEENTPLWLSGWRNGSNTVLMELVDSQGDPLNPPFNSVVREVRIDPSQPAPAWAAALSADQQALLLGEQPSPPRQDITPPAPPAASPEEPGQEPDPPESRDMPASSDAAGGAAQEEPDPEETGHVPGPEASAAAEEAPPSAGGSERPDADGALPEAEQAAAAAPAPERARPAAGEPPRSLEASSRLEGRARDLVNPDGSLIRPRGEGLLGHLRERWSR